MGKSKNRDKGKSKHEVEDQDQDQEITPRKSGRKRKMPSKYGDDEEDVTPEKVPKPGQPTPCKSGRHKDISPPPLCHRQNRMPEQMELI